MALNSGILPSPVLSDCDSLAGIEDLDAFLQAQGPLTSLPTPGPRHACLAPRPFVEYENISPPYTPPDQLPLAYSCSQPGSSACAANAFASVLHSECVHPPAGVLGVLEAIFAQLQLPFELLAIAHSILDASICNGVTHLMADIPGEVWIASSLALADIYTNDNPWSLKHWLDTLDNPTLTIIQLDRSMVAILQSLDWNIYHFCTHDAVQTSMAILRYASMTGHPSTAVLKDTSIARQTPLLPLQPPSITVNTSFVGAYMVNGQLTPGESPPLKSTPPESSCFLRLL